MQDLGKRAHGNGIQTFTLHERIDACNAQEWNAVTAAAQASVYMSPPFIAATEDAFAPESRFVHAILHQEGRAVACGSFCAFPININDFADGAARQVTEVLARVVPFLLKKKVVFCGLPVSVGTKHLAMVPDVEPGPVLETMHNIAADLAAQVGAQYIVFKEFGEEDRARVYLLEQWGYRRFQSPVMHSFSHRFGDFSAYYAALRSRYRQCVRKSQEKAQATQLVSERITDTERILKLYTPELHRMYEAIALSSKHRLELLPISFFHGLVRRMPGQIGLTTLSAGERILAFNWNLFDAERGNYHFLFAGLDYGRNNDHDAYFNVMYAEMDQAFRLGARKISFGQTADEFKTRVGCSQQPLCFYVAPAGRVSSMILRVAGTSIFPEPPPPPVHKVFPDPKPAASVS